MLVDFGRSGKGRCGKCRDMDLWVLMWMKIRQGPATIYSTKEAAIDGQVTTSNRTSLFNWNTQKALGQFHHKLSFVNISGNFDDNLPEMTSFEQVYQGLLRLLKSKHLINNRFDLLFFIKCQHLLKSLFGSVQDSLQCNISQ